MPLYLQWAMSATQIVLAVAVLVGVGFTVWDMTSPVGRCDEDDPEWYVEMEADREE